MLAAVFHQFLGVAIAGLGVLVGCCGMFTAVLRGRGRGFWPSLAGTGLCSVVLILVGALVIGTSRDGLLNPLFVSAAPDQEMMRYLPSNSQLVVSICPGPVVESAAYRDVCRRVPQVARSEAQIEEKVGLPPSQVTRVIIGGNGEAAVFVCRTKNPIVIADLLANMKDARYRQEKVGRYTIYKKINDAFCVAQDKLILFGPPDTLRETLLREGQPDLSSVLQSAIRAADFSKDVVIAANAKDILRKDSRLDSTKVGGWSQEVTDAAIRANAAVVYEITFGKAIESLTTMCCKDTTTAKELKALQEEAVAKAKDDPKTPRALRKSLALQRWALDGPRIVGTTTIDVDTFVELVEQKDE
jgi:hypothetical protein